MLKRERQSKHYGQSKSSRWKKKKDQLSLSVTVNPGSEGYMNFSTSLHTGSYSRPGQHLDFVDTLQVATFPRQPFSPKIAIRWLGLFPALKHVSFTGTCLPLMDRTERVEYIRQLVR
jgi:hypothetical protein